VEKHRFNNKDEKLQKYLIIYILCDTEMVGGHTETQFN